MASRLPFSSLPLHPQTLSYLNSLGYKLMTPVQQIVLPLILKKYKDVIVQACTGSGKTLSYLIPIVEILLNLLKTKKAKINKSKQCHVGGVIVVPTRELSTQVYKLLQEYLLFIKDEEGNGCITAINLKGGKSLNFDKQEIIASGGKYEYTIIVGTPGRMCYLMDELKDEQVWTLKTVEAVMFDEADRLFHLGFAEQLSNILQNLPKFRRTGLFSATITTEISELAKAGLRNPVSVTVHTQMENDSMKRQSALQSNGDEDNTSSTKHSIPDKLSNYYCVLTSNQKFSFLIHFIQKNIIEVGGKAIVFYLTCNCVDYFHDLLSQILVKSKCKSNDNNTNKCLIERLHGKMKADKRVAVYQRFLNCKSGVLICTDVLARGIDLPDVKWIVQMDPPQDPSSFVHRIGRTARAGRSGNSLILLMQHEESYVSFLKEREIQLEDIRNKSNNETSDVLYCDAWISNEEIELLRKQYSRKILQDRSLLLKGIKAFVSYIRAYKEHVLSTILNFKELEIGVLATSFYLLRIPRMKEILGKKLTGFKQSEVDPLSIPFKDKKREETRQLQLVEIRQQKEEMMAQKFKNKRKLEKKPAARTRTQKRTAKRVQRTTEWEELASEELLYKKLKKKKISLQEYNKQLKKLNQEIGINEDSSEE